MQWMTDGWLPGVEVLDWPFYNWCREQHASALSTVADGRAELGALEDRFALEDRDAGMEVDRIVNLRDGGEVPAEEPPPVPTPKTGPLRRDLERKAAAERIAELEAEVHRTAGAIINALPLFVYEFDEAAERGEQAVRREFEEATKRELKARQQFHRDTASEVPDAARCPHCALAPIERNTAWRDVPRSRSLTHEVGRLREWLLGPLLREQVGGFDPSTVEVDDGPAEAQWPTQVAFSGQFDEIVTLRKGPDIPPMRTVTRYERPYPYEHTSVAIRIETGEGADEPPSPVMERPTDAPSFDEVAALEGLEADDHFRERVGWPVGAVVEEMRAA